MHGYRGHDARNNLHYLSSSTSSCIYPAAAACVRLDVAAGRQAFCLEHSDDILSIAVDESRDGVQLVATGEVGKSPLINVFDALKTPMETVLSLKGFHTRGVSHLAFAADGGTLFSVGLDDDHSIAVYGIKSGKGGKLLFSSKGNKQKVSRKE